MSSRSRHLVAAGVLLASVALLGGCGDDDDGAGGPKVLVVGDSVTEMSEDDLQSRMDWAGELTVFAVPGATTGDLLESTAEAVGKEPDVAVFLTGYNDLLADEPDPKSLEAMMELAGTVPCSVWLELPEQNGHSARLAQAWNDNVNELAEAHDGIHVSSAWRELIDESEEFTYVYRRDGLHPNQEGQKALARTMSAEAEDACG